MSEKDFAKRLTQLRMEKNLSARDLSLRIGMNEGYIFEIESGHHMPSMDGFLLVCRYLGITPRDYFDVDSEPSVLPQDTLRYLGMLNPLQLEHLTAIAMDILHIPQWKRDQEKANRQKKN